MKKELEEKLQTKLKKTAKWGIVPALITGVTCYYELTHSDKLTVMVWMVIIGAVASITFVSLIVIAAHWIGRYRQEPDPALAIRYNKIAYRLLQCVVLIIGGLVGMWGVCLVATHL